MALPSVSSIKGVAGASRRERGGLMVRASKLLEHGLIAIDERVGYQNR